MAKKQSKRQRDIKTKLMAAICMLLVSSIMMVSSTYAWFTLSTAPEVTGINTAVGANGNLEMALMPKDGQLTSITSAAGDSSKAIAEKNITWGNLVDVKDSTVYGLDKITLYPAALNLTEAGKIDVTASVLKTPTYGADGRVDQLLANTVTSHYGAEGFLPNDDFGVRAVGTASGMTPRQLSYRNARSAGNTAMNQAANKASGSLNANGSALANIAIKYGMDGTAAEFTAADLVPLRKMIDDLNGEGGVLDQIETAYMQYILAFVASKAGVTAGIDDIAWNAVDSLVNGNNADLDAVIALVGEDNIPSQIMTGINAYKATAADVAEAATELGYMEAKGAAAEFTWSEISKAMTPLANPAAMKINGFTVSEVKNNLGDLVSSVTAQGGLKVVLETGAGVFADIADQTTDYSASVTIEKVEYNGIELNNMTARMETKSSVSPSYLSLVSTAVAAALAPDAGTGTVMPISDMFGYIIDLAFRTNAAESNLLLQQKATDRIYGDNTNEETMGHGATMTFKATTPDFSNEQVKALMSAIKIVFFNPADGTIFCYGGLDVANATVGADGVTAEIYLYKLEATTTTTYKAATPEQVADGNTVLYTRSGEEGSYTYTVVDRTTMDPDGTYYVAEVTTGAVSQVKITDNKIMALTQNTATALSVLVYLDGEMVTNKDVAATGSTSMTGTMNLQFASSATLVPMEYSDLHIPGGNTETTVPETTVPETTTP